MLCTNKPGQREPVRGPLPKGNVQRFARVYKDVLDDVYRSGLRERERERESNKLFGFTK